MSTPPTGDGGGAPRPLRLLRGRPGADRRRAGRPDPRTFPGGTLPQPDPIEPNVVRARDTAWLLERARRRGAKAATGKVFDPWVLNTPDRIPYFAELASLRDRVRNRLAEEGSRADEAAALEASRARAAATAADERVARAAERRAFLERRRDLSIAQLDRLAQRADRWQRFRDTVRLGFEQRWLRDRMPPPGPDPGATTDPYSGSGGSGGSGSNGGPDPAPGHPRWQPVSENDPADPADPAASGVAGTVDPSIGTRAAWEGITARPGMPPWGKFALLVLLAAIELPVYYIVFQSLHGTGRFADTLSISLTIAVSLTMILAPHFAGRSLRRRSITGGIRLSALPALALTAIWGYGAWALGDLRARFVFQEEPPLDLPADVVDTVPESVRNPPSLVETLDLAPDSVKLMFIALLLLSGGIAFLLALGEEHPYLAAYRTNAERLTALERETEADIAGAERAKEAEAALDTRMTARHAAQEARLHAVGDLYEAAAHAYLDGLAGASADPAVTEAAMRLSRQWPLLPR
ncbi:hypothetical protein ACWF94_12600 [Streptomyces sp. NPDC055078]